MMKHIAIVGNIGSGKTSLTRMIAEHYGWQAAFESVDNNPYLEDFYSNMHAWAFHLQIFFLNSRFQQVKHIQQSQNPVVQDRTIYEDAHIFARNLHLSGYLSERDYANYHAIYDSITQTIAPPDLLIYLKADVPKLLQQIEKRGRDYEASIPEAYLGNLNDLYHDWVGNYQHGPIITFNMNDIDFVASKNDFQGILQTIDNERLAQQALT
jgi:deoxyadenosine/deoxycytidine kinase